jgi:hypothetical protein
VFSDFLTSPWLFKAFGETLIPPYVNFLAHLRHERRGNNERSAFLDEKCGEDTELRREIDRTAEIGWRRTGSWSLPQKD